MSNTPTEQLPPDLPTAGRQQPQPRPRWFSATVVAGFCLAALIGLGFWAGQPAGDGSQQKIVTVPPGASAKKVAAKLHDTGLLRSQLYFRRDAKLTGKSSAIKAGPYQFTDGMAPAEILRKLVNGDIYVWRFAVPEGYSTFQLAEMMASRKIVAKEAFLAACTDPALLREFGIAGPSVEGYLYPSTYDLTPGSSAATIIRVMVRQFDKEFNDRFASALKGQKRSRHEVVTLASLVEKEAVSPQERPQIAAVFLNRLRLRMRLQSDPTAVYGKRAFGGTVSAQEVRQATPYNTYVIPGLPPGPIGNPSAEAIAAVLAPASVPYLYFVARKDGTHYFSTTLAEHNQAVARYLKNGAR